MRSRTEAVKTGSAEIFVAKAGHLAELRLKIGPNELAALLERTERRALVRLLDNIDLPAVRLRALPGGR